MSVTLPPDAETIRTRRPPLKSRTIWLTVLFVEVTALAAAFAIFGQSDKSSRFSHRDDLTPEEVARIEATLASPTDFGAAQAFEINAGGAATSTAKVNANAFSHPSKNLTLEGRERFFVGNGLFRKIWVSPPSSTIASDGLGPLFNARGCQSCHLKDGRGHPPAGAGDSVESLLVRISILPQTEEDRRALTDGHRSTIPDPVYGGQVQDNAVAGLPAEAKVSIAWRETEMALNGARPARLRRPVLSLDNPGYGPFAAGLMTSIRVAPQMIGLGLLDAIHPGDIAALEDPQDSNGDGVSGRAHRVRDPETGATVLGRFGWKAAMPTVKAQNADAFLNDMGISNPLHPVAQGECTTRQTQCHGMPNGVQPQLGDTEAPDPVLELVAFYASNLAVPARRDVDSPQVLRGKAAFHDAGCASCHQPNYVTRKDAELPEHRFQLIWPYTDLLLHDMGDDLADNRPDGQANGREWRTPPLWGIGLTKTVSGHSQFLHDGRARSLLEAILWHGGEADAARKKVADMTPELRADLIAFLESL